MLSLSGSMFLVSHCPQLYSTYSEQKKKSLVSVRQLNKEGRSFRPQNLSFLDRVRQNIHSMKNSFHEFLIINVGHSWLWYILDPPTIFPCISTHAPLSAPPSNKCSPPLGQNIKQAPLKNKHPPPLLYHFLK